MNQRKPDRRRRPKLATTTAATVAAAILLVVVSVVVPVGAGAQTPTVRQGMAGPSSVEVIFDAPSGSGPFEIHVDDRFVGNPTSSPFTVTGLQSDRTYNVGVDGWMNGSKFNVGSASMRTGGPATASNTRPGGEGDGGSHRPVGGSAVQVTGQTGTTVSLGWPDRGTAYEIWTDGGFTASTSSRSYIAAGLKPGRTYRFTVKVWIGGAKVDLGAVSATPSDDGPAVPAGAGATPSGADGSNSTIRRPAPGTGNADAVAVLWAMANDIEIHDTLVNGGQASTAAQQQVVTGAAATFKNWGVDAANERAVQLDQRSGMIALAAMTWLDSSVPQEQLRSLLNRVRSGVVGGGSGQWAVGSALDATGLFGGSNTMGAVRGSVAGEGLVWGLLCPAGDCSNLANSVEFVPPPTMPKTTANYWVHRKRQTDTRVERVRALADRVNREQTIVRGALGWARWHADMAGKTGGVTSKNHLGDAYAALDVAKAHIDRITELKNKIDAWAEVEREQRADTRTVERAHNAYSKWLADNMKSGLINSGVRAKAASAAADGQRSAMSTRAVPSFTMAELGISDQPVFDDPRRNAARQQFRHGDGSDFDHQIENISDDLDDMSDYRSDAVSSAVMGTLATGSAVGALMGGKVGTAVSVAVGAIASFSSGKNSSDRATDRQSRAVADINAALAGTGVEIPDPSALGFRNGAQMHASQMMAELEENVHANMTKDEFVAVAETALGNYQAKNSAFAYGRIKGKDRLAATKAQDVEMAAAKAREEAVQAKADAHQASKNAADATANNPSNPNGHPSNGAPSNAPGDNAPPGGSPSGGSTGSDPSGGGSDGPSSPPGANTNGGAPSDGSAPPSGTGGGGGDGGGSGDFGPTNDGCGSCP